MAPIYLEGCPSSTPKTTGGEEVTASGKSTFFSDSTDLGFATDKAEANLKGKLGRQSGVVCAICDDSGLQCALSVEFGEGTPSSDPTFLPGETQQESGWKVTAGWTGEYTVNCATCPSPEPV